MNDLFPKSAFEAPILNGEVIRSDASSLLRTLDPSSVQVIVTDPPYGIAYHSNYYKDKNPHTPIAQDWNFQIGTFLDDASRVLKDGGAVYLFTRHDVYPLWAKEIPPGLKMVNAIIWKKDNWSSGDLTGNFGNQYEILMFLVKGRHRLRGHRWPNVWDFARIPAKKLRMPAEKPLGLYERAIQSSSDEGDLVVDPFCGSGTAAEAATRTARRFIVGDMDPKMISMTRRRLGLPILEDHEAAPSLPSCPIFNVTPPDISLWGLHPEDVSEFKGASALLGEDRK